MIKEKQSRKTEGLGRRDFLTIAGMGAGAAALAGGAQPTPAAAAEPEAERGYRETEHVRRYYQLARF